MKNVTPHSIGLVFGGVLAIFHTIWALCVWAGIAQPFLDLIFMLHMIKPPYTVQPFDLATAITLVAITGIIGYLMGCIFGFLWKKFIK